MSAASGGAGGGGVRRVGRASELSSNIVFGGDDGPRNKWGAAQPHPLAQPQPQSASPASAAAAAARARADEALGLADLEHVAMPPTLPPQAHLPLRRGGGGGGEGGSAAAGGGGAAAVDANFNAAVASRRGDFMRVLSSRLAEVKELSALWRSAVEEEGKEEAADVDGSAPTLAVTPERVYVATLRHLRNSCQEWAAVDVLAQLAHCSGAGGGGGGGGGGDALQLRGGLPVWAFPRATSLRWARYLCPVLQGLLFSAYEDYLESAVGACDRVLDALAPLFAAASDPLRVAVADLAVPAALAQAGGDEGDAGGASTGEGEGEGEGDSGGGEGGHARSRRWRLLAHAAAVGAVQAVRLTQPLASALGVAASTVRAGGGSGETQRFALRVQRRMLRLHEGVMHLVRASARA
jgi:hypothetical protein